MTTPDPLATYLITGGLPRVCEELARLMRACHHAGWDGYQLPSAYDRCADSCSYPVEMGGLCRKCLNHMRYDPRLSWTAHSAPTSSPGEDKRETARHFAETTEENCATRLPYSDPLMAFREVIRWRDMQARTYEDGCELLERFNKTNEELERVRAENARLKEENRRLTEDDAAQRKLAAVLGMMHEPCMGPTWPASWEALTSRVTQLTESERLVSELRAELEKERTATDEVTRAWSNEQADRSRTEAELRAELAKRDEGIAKLERVDACARTLLVYLFTTGRIENHGHREWPGACAECEQVNGLLAALNEATVDGSKLDIEQHQAEPVREIVVGSVWQKLEPMQLTINSIDDFIRYTRGDHVCGMADEYWFREHCTHVSDPPVSEGEG